MPQQTTVGLGGSAEQWRYLAELKWSESPPRSPKISEVLWDALKMLAASQRPYIEAAYIVTAGRRGEWERPARGSELFTTGEWEVRELLDKYQSEWRHLVKTSGPPPRRLPAAFRTDAIAEAEVGDFVVKSAWVSSDAASGSWVTFTDGFPDSDDRWDGEDA